MTDTNTTAMPSDEAVFLDAERDSLTAQVAALRDVTAGLIALTKETADHDHQASDWGVFVRDAQAVLTDTTSEGETK